jgi:hypothetical protein
MFCNTHCRSVISFYTLELRRFLCRGVIKVAVGHGAVTAVTAVEVLHGVVNQQAAVAINNHQT